MTDVSLFTVQNFQYPWTSAYALCVSCACVMAAQIGYQLKTISLLAVYLSVNQSVSRRHSLEQLSVVYTWLQRRPGTGLVLFGKLL